MLKHPERLDGVNPELVSAIEYLAAEFKKIDILVVCGKRTEEEQLKLYKTKKSKVYGPKAPHVLGNAVDLCPMEKGICLWEGHELFKKMREVLGRVIALKPVIIWDKNHFEVKL